MSSLRRHYECLVSICAHDAPAFLRAQIANVAAHVPNCAIVVHLNGVDERELEPAGEHVWINPRRHATGPYKRATWEAWASNVIHGYAVAAFDRVLFLSSSSSCLFFRTVRWEDMPKNLVCVDNTSPHSPATLSQPPPGDWFWADVFHDARLVGWLRAADGADARVYGGQLSGVMLPEAAMAELLDLTGVDGCHGQHDNYMYEEVYAQTVGLRYAERTGAPVQTTLIQIQWARDGAYGLCRFDHDVDGPSMARLRRLQARCPTSLSFSS